MMIDFFLLNLKSRRAAMLELARFSSELPSPLCSSSTSFDGIIIPLSIAVIPGNVRPDHHAQ